MSELVLDCSVAVCWLFRNEATPQTDAIYLDLRQRRSTAFVPLLFPLEAMNVLLQGVRRGRCTRPQAERFLKTLLKLPLWVDGTNDPTALNRIMGIAASGSLTSYDAAYLELAERRGIPLATKDNQLSSVANGAVVELLL